MSLYVDKLNFSYKKQKVLKDVSFFVEEGDCLVVLGENGAGKSTLLRCIAGLCRYEGSVKICGDEVRLLPPEKRARTIAIVTQNDYSKSGTVFQNVLSGRIPYLKWAPQKEDNDLVQWALKLLDIEDISHKSVNEISGGEAQKVAFARALCQEPKILLLDEPTSSLDLKGRLKVGELIDLMKKQNITTVVTMHDVNLALAFGDKFLFLKDGGCLYFGGKDSISASLITSVYGVDGRIVQIDGRPYFV